MSPPAVLLLIAGPPCSGKSTLAARLQQHLAWPLLAKDAIKERAFQHLGGRDRDWSRRVSDLAWDVLFDLAGQLVRSGGSAIIEGNFRPEHAGRLRALAPEAALRFLQVQCQADGGILWRRFEMRASAGLRHAGHVDREVAESFRAELLAGRHADLALPGAILRHDTGASGEPALGDLLQQLDAALWTATPGAAPACDVR